MKKSCKTITRMRGAMLMLTAWMLCAAILAPSALADDHGFTLSYGDRTQPRIAITVDDCTSRDKTREVLDLCEQYDIPVTFFVIGKVLEDTDQALWQDAIDLGCEIGNHTWWHKRLTGLTDKRIKAGLVDTQARLDELLGYHYPMQVMRPPYGVLSADDRLISENRIRKSIMEAGYEHAIRWDIDSQDFKAIMKRVKNGSILLFHTGSADLKCIRQLIPALLAEGYECVTLSELFDLGEIVPIPFVQDADIGA